MIERSSTTTPTVSVCLMIERSFTTTPTVSVCLMIKRSFTTTPTMSVCLSHDRKVLHNNTNSVCLSHDRKVLHSNTNSVCLSVCLMIERSSTTTPTVSVCLSHVGTYPEGIREQDTEGKTQNYHGRVYRVVQSAVQRLHRVLQLAYRTYTDIRLSPVGLPFFPPTAICIYPGW
jgi:anthranilate/para-aminobenzoate synthase component II